MGIKQPIVIFISITMVFLACFYACPESVDARTSHEKSSAKTKKHSVTMYSGKHRRTVAVAPSRSRSKSKGRRGRRHVIATPKVRYAYPLTMFLWSAPHFDHTPVDDALKQKIRYAFLAGTAEKFPARSLVRAEIVEHYPLRGGIFYRREAVKYVVVHSTETGIPMNGKRVIDSWSSVGRRHAGAQYVVDRDGMIYQSVDPDLATVHVNIFKTLPGINNDNSIGIEMVHTGAQTYTPEQKASVIRLVSYLQDRYKVMDENVITHRYAQQGDHTDPVAFDWDRFLKDKAGFRRQAVVAKMNEMVDEAGKWWNQNVPGAPIYQRLEKMLPGPTSQNHKPTQPANAIPAPLLPPVSASNLRGPIEEDPDNNLNIEDELIQQCATGMEPDGSAAVRAVKPAVQNSFGSPASIPGSKQAPPPGHTILSLP